MTVEGTAVTGIEIQPSQESLQPFQEMTGVQFRFALGNQYIHPDGAIPDTVQTADIQNFQNRDYSAFENASTHSRLQRTQEMVAEGKLAAETFQQKQQWIDQVKKVLTADKHKAKVEKLSPLLQQLGIHPDEIDNKAIQRNLYERFFENQDLDHYVVEAREGEKKYFRSDVKGFIQAVLNTHMQNGNLQYDELKEHLAEYRWFARIFGRDMQEAIAQMIDAEAQILKDKQQFIEKGMQKQANTKPRADTENLTNEEKEPLLYVATHGRIGEKPINRDILNNIPQPQSPLKIADRIVNIDSTTNQATEHPETWLISGTEKHPLIVEARYEDGTRQKERVYDAERDYHIPAVILLDEDLTPEQTLLIKTTYEKVFNEIGVPKEMIIFSNSSAAAFFKDFPPGKKRGDQYDADQFVQEMLNKSNQIDSPHHFVVFTNKDLYAENMNFILGSAWPDLGTVISLKRLTETIPNKQQRERALKTEIAHEIGHVYGLPSERRGKHQLDDVTVHGGGDHCKSPGCSMKQGNTIPEDFIQIAEDRVQHLGDNHFFCQECHTDLEAKFEESKDGNQIHIQLEPKDLEEVLPNAITQDERKIAFNAEHNLHAAGQFVTQFEEMKDKATRLGPNRLQNDFRLIYDDAGWYQYNHALHRFMDEYHIPLAIYDSGGHANLLLNIYRDKKDGQLKMVYWDPMKSGENITNVDETPIQVKILPNQDELIRHAQSDMSDGEYYEMLNQNGIAANSPFIREMLKGNETFYDLTLAGDQQLSPITKAGKLTYLQPPGDAQNCVLYSIFGGIVRTAAKYRTDEAPPELQMFFQYGLTKFESDFGIRVATRDEILRRQL